MEVIEEDLKYIEDFILENYTINNLYPSNYRFFNSIINVVYYLRKNKQFSKTLDYREIADFIQEIKKRKKKELNVKYGMKNYKTTITPEELAEAFGKHIPNIE